MINTLFSKNPVFMCFGGGGSGGSSAGAASSGGGSRADRKGAAATFSAPKPVYTPPPPTNTSRRDRRDRTPVAPVVNYGALPSTPPPSVVTPPMRSLNPSPAPSVIDGLSNVQFVSKNTTPSYMSDFQRTGEIFSGGRGSGAAEVAMRQGPIGNSPATDYSKVYAEQGIPDPNAIRVATNILGGDDKKVDPLSMEWWQRRTWSS